MILITGATGGIGGYLFQRYLAINETVRGTCHLSKPKPEWAEYLTKLNISDITMVREWLTSIGDKLKNITLINCAGINYNSFAHNADLEKWKQVVETNVTGTFNVIQAILPYMRAQNYGRIINFSSVAAQKGVCGTSSYAASKSALWGLTKSLAVENATKGVTINNLNLGYFDIGMIKQVPEKQLTSIINSIPMGKLGDPANIYQAIEFLRNADYITGTHIDINGGLF